MEITNKTPLLSLPIEQLPAQGYRRDQIASWLYEKGAASWDTMTNLPKALRTELSEQYRISEFSQVTPYVSQDGSVKYLYTLHDHKQTEAVYMPYLNRKTICISSMVGCPAGCTFCATGKMGFGRNLTAAEIVDQVLYAALDQQHSPREIRNVVLMGMGEPLLNVDNVFLAIERMLHPAGLAMSPRRITLSTVGIPKGIYKMADADLEVRLALSLHAPDDETRQKIIPTAHRYSLEEIMESVRYYYSKTKRRVTLEYTMLQGLNDQPWQAKALAKHLQGLSAHLNLIPWNPWEGALHRGSSKDQIMKFAALLQQQGWPVSVRWSRGRDVGAACGQLALSVNP
jgi:23S rRNA (adenine2503-C2)-methyltransferase